MGTPNDSNNRSKGTVKESVFSFLMEAEELFNNLANGNSWTLEDLAGIENSVDRHAIFVDSSSSYDDSIEFAGSGISDVEEEHPEHFSHSSSNSSYSMDDAEEDYYDHNKVEESDYFGSNGQNEGTFFGGDAIDEALSLSDDGINARDESGGSWVSLGRDNVPTRSKWQSMLGETSSILEVHDGKDLLDSVDVIGRVPNDVNTGQPSSVTVAKNEKKIAQAVDGKNQSTRQENVDKNHLRKESTGSTGYEKRTKGSSDQSMHIHVSESSSKGKGQNLPGKDSLTKRDSSSSKRIFGRRKNESNAKTDERERPTKQSDSTLKREILEGLVGTMKGVETSESVSKRESKERLVTPNKETPTKGKGSLSRREGRERNTSSNDGAPLSEKPRGSEHDKSEPRKKRITFRAENVLNPRLATLTSDLGVKDETLKKSQKLKKVKSNVFPVFTGQKDDVGSYVEHMLQAMTRYGNSATAQQKACRSISRVAVYEQFRPIIWEAGTVDKILATIYRHSDNPRVIDSALGALLNLALDDDIKEDITGMNALNVPLNAMEVFKDDVRLQRNASGFMRNMTHRNLKFQSDFVANGGLSIIDSVLENHGTDKTIQENGLAILLNMTVESANGAAAKILGDRRARMNYSKSVSTDKKALLSRHQMRTKRCFQRLSSPSPNFKSSDYEKIENISNHEEQKEDRIPDVIVEECTNTEGGLEENLRDKEVVAPKDQEVQVVGRQCSNDTTSSESTCHSHEQEITTGEENEVDLVKSDQSYMLSSNKAPNKRLLKGLFKKREKSYKKKNTLRDSSIAETQDVTEKIVHTNCNEKIIANQEQKHDANKKSNGFTKFLSSDHFYLNDSGYAGNSNASEDNTKAPSIDESIDDDSFAKLNFDRDDSELSSNSKLVEGTDSITEMHDGKSVRTSGIGTLEYNTNQSVSTSIATQGTDFSYYADERPFIDDSSLHENRDAFDEKDEVQTVTSERVNDVAEAEDIINNEIIVSHCESNWIWTTAISLLNRETIDENINIMQPPSLPEERETSIAIVEEAFGETPSVNEMAPKTDEPNGEFIEVEWHEPPRSDDKSSFKGNMSITQKSTRSPKNSPSRRNTGRTLTSLSMKGEKKEFRKIPQHHRPSPTSRRTTRPTTRLAVNGFSKRKTRASMRAKPTYVTQEVHATMKKHDHMKETPLAMKGLGKGGEPTTQKMNVRITKNGSPEGGVV
eukprot:CAMPEP_0194279588 /NCGR_PEP_ID=MMETSP0169-20130528/14014_1 /TAXON_ID=218684 /ORGANISM="Corethron pennatum, Strain L29A3" /LENGTH=1206 /DNA_ID=CAMNT_0039024033 /DNA_START=275 /DNA_END=3896 /DNA_ORIENTATION=+